MSQVAQSYQTHRKLVPAYHYVTSSTILVALIWFVSRLVRDPSVDHAMMVVLIVGLALTSWFARVFPLGVQDRVIRLEERLRMERLLPDELKSRIGEFTTGQLIGLRFASDDELPELARRVLDEGLKERDAIKKAVGRWRADDQRI